MILQNTIKKTITDVRWWIVFFFLVRLYGITDPPIEVVHSWRQCTVAMVARNFYEVDNNILYPRIDIGGSGTGIEGMEFPLLNYLIYLVSLLFGYEHWYGRLINLMVSSMGAWYFFRITERYFGQRIALCATVLLQCSMWLLYMRKMMPDTFSASLILMALYFGMRYLRVEANWRGLILYTLLLCAGLLSKITSGVLCGAIVVPWILAGAQRKFVLAACSIVAAIPVLWWYFSWVPFLRETYHTGHFFMGVPLRQGLMELAGGLKELTGFFVISAMKYSGFAAFAAGILFLFSKKEKALLYTILAMLLLLLLVLAKGGNAVLQHDYYMVPFVPVMVLVASYGLAQLPARWMYLTGMVLICTEGILNQLHDFRIKPEEAEMMHLEKTLDTFSQRTDLVAINSDINPTPMYMAHRKGWLCNNTTLMNWRGVMEMHRQGLKYIVVMKNMYQKDCILVLPQVYEDEAVRVYTLTALSQ